MLGGRNKHRSQPLGYTIVEVMIVLAVSAVMFLVAANFINGKQEKAAFAQGSNDTGSKLQSIVEEVTDGHYSDVPLQCSISGSTLQVSTSGSGSQGENSNCVFMGKIVRFYDPNGGLKRTNYGIYSIAADRNIANFPDDLIGAVSGLTTKSVIPQSLYVKKMSVVDTSNHSHNAIYNVGFLQGIGNVSGGGVYLTGAQQQVQLVYANTASSSESSIAGTTIQPAKSATICLTDEVRYAEVLIGGSTSTDKANSNNNDQLNISVRQLGTASC